MIGDVMRCPKCNSEDYYEYDSRVNLPELYGEFSCVCNDCDCYFDVDVTLMVDRVEEKE